MLARLLRRFAADERGIFAVIFAVMAIVLTATAGAVVDYISVDQVRNRAQIALDSAALALQPLIYTKTTTELKTSAQKLLVERVNDTHITAVVSSAEVDTTNGRLILKANLTVPMAFVALIGINQMTTQILSQVTRKKLYIEVAYVLDNSGSMTNESRMTNLKSAANCATNILFYGSCTPANGATKNANTKIAVVPFNFFVNVGSGNANASWLDKTGRSSIANDNFDSDDSASTAFSGTVDRLSLFTGMGKSWSGCIEARPYPYSVNDTTPNASTPDTLFVPEFAPDEPDGSGWDYDFNNSYISDTGGSCISPTFVWTQLKRTCNKNGANSTPTNYDTASCTGTTTNSYLLTYPDGTISTTVTSAPSTIKGWNSPSSSSTYSSASAGTNRWNNTRVTTYTYQLPDREKQERLCKYSGATPSNMAFDYGPNAGCVATSILPLTDTVATINSRVSAMVANGATNIHQGVIWGFHALSPTDPFSEGRAYGTATSKVMIVMTDGENTYYPAGNMNGTQIYGPYGYLWNGRVGTNGSESAASMQTKTDNLTLEACASAKAAGITIYTIGLKPPNQATKTMLTNCASESSKAYFPTQSSDLNTVFASIAEQLAQLRIEK